MRCARLSLGAAPRDHRFGLGLHVLTGSHERARSKVEELLEAIQPAPALDALGPYQALQRRQCLSCGFRGRVDTSSCSYTCAASGARNVVLKRGVIARPSERLVKWKTGR